MADIHNPDWTQIPCPADDDKAAHLLGAKLPSTTLVSTRGDWVDISSLSGTVVVYAYPMTGRPDIELPKDWDLLPGARGCTPQSCAFRDHNEELQGLGVNALFGLSTQSTEYQQEAVNRLHLPFSLLSDEQLQLQKALNLPTMQVEGKVLLKRLTLIITEGVITKVFYPVFPPDRNATDVIDWLKG